MSIDIVDEEGGFNVEAFREVAHKELEIARLMGPSNDLENDWVQYLKQVVSLTDDWLARAKVSA